MVGPHPELLALLSAAVSRRSLGKPSAAELFFFFRRWGAVLADVPLLFKLLGRHAAIAVAGD
jgi:hypothetical protein